MAKTDSVFGVILKLSFGMGAIFGSLEAIYLLFTLPWHFSFLDALRLGAASAVAGVVLSFLIGIIAASIAMIKKNNVISDRWAAGMSIVAFLQMSAILGTWLGQLFQQEQWISFAIMFSSLFLFTFVIWQNARFWLRKALLRPPRFGWLGTSFTISALLLGIGILLSQNRGYGASNVIESDPDVFLISMDGIGANAISKWSTESLAQTPNLDAKMGHCIQYTDAISVFPDPLMGHVAMLSGLYPGQLNLISEDDVLRLQINTVTEKFAREGYATASFVSNEALNSNNGFSQGFQLFDNDLGLWFTGASRIQVFGLIQTFLSQVQSRTSALTLERAEEFLQFYRSKPVFTFIQLQIPDGLSKAEYAEEVALLDRDIGDFLRTLDRREIERNKLLILTSAFGMTWKRTTDSGEHIGLSEDVIRVPMVICPLKGGTKTVSDSQVRTMDLVNTIYNQVGFSNIKELPSADIVSNLDSEEIPVYQTFLMSRDPYSFVGGYTLGYRLKAKNSTYIYKYQWHSSRRKHSLYNLSLDPGESKNRISIAEDMTMVLAEALMANSTSIKGLDIPESERKMEVLEAE